MDNVRRNIDIRKLQMLIVCYQTLTQKRSRTAKHPTERPQNLSLDAAFYADMTVCFSDRKAQNL
jgi:hypothetical protein